MRYINLRFTYLLTYLLIENDATERWCLNFVSGLFCITYRLLSLKESMFCTLSPMSPKTKKNLQKTYINFPKTSIFIPALTA